MHEPGQIEFGGCLAPLAVADLFPVNPNIEGRFYRTEMNEDLLPLP